MSPFGEDLIQTLKEALAHAKGEGPATVHTLREPHERCERRTRPRGTSESAVVLAVRAVVQNRNDQAQ